MIIFVKMLIIQK